ncbi:type IV secretion system DNA-binding domain-containing protein [Acidithiobacillus ferrooxidans]|uniref:type IV secretion system DNA-binding domain-containing protein n=1 Tax=Acidithiobacillus ferrooxidans TaxID=920 RepID=UPI000A81810C|nr:type IV secretion system DNA-binding domain-containing protein [Acidithiobacillus ferrooxidans]
MSAKIDQYTGPNDPRFQSGSGFFQGIGIASAAGAIAGYGLGWEGIGLYKTGAFLSPDSLFSVIHQLGPLPHVYAPVLLGSTVACAVAGAVVGWKAGAIPAEIHVRGSRLTTKSGVMQKAIAEASAPVRGKNQGIRIHPRIQTTEHLEASHMLILGGSGAGKTTILWPMIQQLVTRGDKMLVFSFKGDFEQKLDVPRYALLAPWDTRSATWALGRDVRTRLDAESLAETLIPEPAGGQSDPMWVNGSRALLVGIIADVQRSRGDKWGFADLAKRVAEALSDFPTLQEIIRTESPMAGALLSGGADSKTTASFLSTIASYMSHVINLGVSEDNLLNTQTKRKEWSVNGWLAGDVPAVSILGFRPSAKGISRAWGASIIEQIVQKCGDLPDADPDQRRIWLILDEVPRLGKVPSITEGLEVLRSKGVRIVLGAQGIGQIEEIYSKTTARSWAMQTATKIIGRIVEPEDQKWAAGLIGERVLERYSASQNTQLGGSGGGSSGGSYQRVQEHTVIPSQLGQIVRVSKSGPRAILQVAGSDQVGLLDWPFASAKTLRPGRDEMQAAWVLPGYNRPIWGTVPPKVADAEKAKATTTKTDQAIAAAAIARAKHDEAAARMHDVAAAFIADRVPAKPKTDETGSETGTDSIGDEAESAVADHVAGQALDVMITGGAGTLFEMLKTYGDITAPASAPGQGTGQIGPARILPATTTSTSTNDEADDDDEDFAER